MNNETLGQRLKRLRVDKSYTQDYLSYLSGVSKNSISNIERGLTPNLRVPKKSQEYLAYYLGVSVEYLLYGIDTGDIPNIPPEEPDILHKIKIRINNSDNKQLFETLCDIIDSELDKKEIDLLIYILKGFKNNK